MCLCLFTPLGLTQPRGGFFFFFSAAWLVIFLTTLQVTTTRKIFSVLLSIFVHNHKLNTQGWAGIGLSCAGIMGELQDKYQHGRTKKGGASD